MRLIDAENLMTVTDICEDGTCKIATSCLEGKADEPILVCAYDVDRDTICQCAGLNMILNMKLSAMCLTIQSCWKARDNMTESEKLIENEAEAIDCLKSNKPTSGYLMLQGSIDMAINALEKQVPKKPTPIDYEKYTDVIDNAKFLKGAYWCPNCKHVVKSGTFCKDCGQKLDWSEESEGK